MPALSWTSPNSVQPGTVEASFSVTLRNNGQASQGPISADLISDSPALTISEWNGLICDRNSGSQ